jgi:hypothetical protein
VSPSSRKDQPGPEELAELEREERRDAEAEVSERADVEDDDDGDGDETVSEILEVDQTELDELGLTLDDPHQPDSE